MKCAVVVDSGCDLPQAYIEQNSVLVLPLLFKVDGKVRVDNLNTRQKISIYQNELLSRDHDAESLPTEVKDVSRFFMEHVVTKYDFVIGQTVAQSRSPTYENWKQASGEIQANYHQPRKNAGIDRPFTFRILNSGTFFSGQGLMAIYTVDKIREGTTRNKIRTDLEEFKKTINALTVPSDVAYLRERARKKGDRTIGLLSSFIGKALDIVPIIRGDNDSTEPVGKVKGRANAVNQVFDHIIEKIQSGLNHPAVCISVAGELDSLNEFDGYSRLQEAAKEAGVKIYTTVMGMAGGINLGPGALSVSFACNDRDYSFS
jgi:DegV family protein with EDD domain